MFAATLDHLKSYGITAYGILKLYWQKQLTETSITFGWAQGWLSHIGGVIRILMGKKTNLTVAEIARSWHPLFRVSIGFLMSPIYKERCKKYHIWDFNSVGKILKRRSWTDFSITTMGYEFNLSWRGHFWLESYKKQILNLSALRWDVLLDLFPWRWSLKLY